MDEDVWAVKMHKNNICPVCKINTKDRNADICIDCYLKKKSANIPQKEVLIDLILKYPMIEIGRMYGVSDNAVRKWCKKYGLPFSKTDIAKIR